MSKPYTHVSWSEDAMAAVQTKIFKSGNSDAVRLPKDISFGADISVMVERTGDIVTIRPVRKTVAWMIEQLQGLPVPGEIEKREPIEFPERPGL